MGTALATRSEVEPVPSPDPGGFPRHPKTGAPYVTDPTKQRKPTGKKDELLAKCAARGIEVPAKATIAVLQDLLGPEMALSMYGRPSSLGKQIENMTNLQKWSERAVALGMYLDPEIWADIARLDPGQLTLDDDETKDLLDRVAVQAKATAQAGIAAERGTHTHALTEDFDNEADWIERARSGEDLGIPHAAQAALVAAWEQMLEVNDLEILAVETAVVDDKWRQAGTLDRIARLRKGLNFVLPGGEVVLLPGGTVIVLDVKTGRLRCDRGIVSYWHGYAVQIASYAQSVPYDPATGQRGTWEWPIDQRYALIAHLDVLAALDGAATCRLVLVDLAAGRKAGERCVWARQWEKRTDVFSLVTDADDTAVTVPVEIAEEGDRPPAASSSAPVAAPDRPASDPALELANVTLDWAESLRLMLRDVWPVDLPTPKAVRTGAATWDAGQMMRARAAIDEIVGSWTDADRTAPTTPRAEAPVDVEPHVDPTGGPLDQASLDHLMARIKASPCRSIVNGWLHEADAVGKSWSPRAKPNVRHFEISSAAFWLASIIEDAPEDATDETFVDLVRSILAAAMGTEAALMPANPIGVVLSHLTIAEAVAVATAAQDLVEQRSTLTFSSDGRAVLVAA